MKKILTTSLFVLATFTWTLAQNTGAYPSGGQQQPPSATSPASPAPDSPQSQTPPAGNAGQVPAQPGAQPGAQTQAPEAANAPITEGCLAGSEGAYTLTATNGKSYKLNFPSTANTSVLTSHLGASVRVQGDVQDAKAGQEGTINASKIGRGHSDCPKSSSAPSGSAAPGGSAAPTGSAAPSTAPNSATAREIRARNSSSLDTSQLVATALPSAPAPSSAAASFTLPALTSARTTFAPSARKAAAVPRPRPCAAPVTTTLRPLKRCREPWRAVSGLCSISLSRVALNGWVRTLRAYNGG